MESSPWFVHTLEDFLYFCCPECDDREKSRTLFLEHALNQHSESQKYLQNFTLEKIENHSTSFDCNADHITDLDPLLVLKTEIKEENEYSDEIYEDVYNDNNLKTYEYKKVSISKSPNKRKQTMCFPRK